MLKEKVVSWGYLAWMAKMDVLDLLHVLLDHPVPRVIQERLGNQEQTLQESKDMLDILVPADQREIVGPVFKALQVSQVKLATV